MDKKEQGHNSAAADAAGKELAGDSAQSQQKQGTPRQEGATPIAGKTGGKQDEGAKREASQHAGAKPEHWVVKAGHEPGAEHSEFRDRLLRLQAEFDNFKKRTEKEKASLARASEGMLLLRLLPVYEEIRMAEQEAEKVNDEGLKKGILLVLSKLRSSFEKEGLQEMPVECGMPSDPFRHEVAMSEESGLPEGAVVRVIRKGYAFRGEVLRHAAVSVSSGKEEKGMPGKKGGDAKGAAEEGAKQ